VPRPEGWSGLRVVPQRIEFWYGAQFRLHERWCYEVDHDGQWNKRLLFP
jgi:pyridoxamine 5'-phosphate oxidase